MVRPLDAGMLPPSSARNQGRKEGTHWEALPCTQQGAVEGPGMHSLPRRRLQRTILSLPPEPNRCPLLLVTALPDSVPELIAAWQAEHKLLAVSRDGKESRRAEPEKKAGVWMQGEGRGGGPRGHIEKDGLDLFCASPWGLKAPPCSAPPLQGFP